MAESAVGKREIKNRDLDCPRDQHRLQRKVVGEAELDVCGKCGGQFFDQGEMFSSFGIKADPSYWDRPETGGVMKPSDLSCMRCGTHILAQDVKYDAHNVEIDRCGKCGGIWLDKGEVESIMAIGEKLQPLIDAEKAKAQADLAALGDVDFAPGLIARFLRLFKRG